VSLHDGTLTISGERKSDPNQKDAQVYRSERYFGRFERSVTLPSAVTAEKISAQYKDGVLTITLPKAEEAKPKQIDININ
jgi:HSP20 family protein